MNLRIENAKAASLTHVRAYGGRAPRGRASPAAMDANLRWQDGGSLNVIPESSREFVRDLGSLGPGAAAGMTF
jgi:hypothetical protein